MSLRSRYIQNSTIELTESVSKNESQRKVGDDMRRSLIALGMLGLAGVLTLTGCSTTNIDCKYDVGTTHGQPIAYVSTSRLGFHWFGSYPGFGDASLTKTFSEFNAEAKRLRGAKVQIVQSNRTRYWIVFFPFSLILTPVTSEVAGDVLP